MVQAMLQEIRKSQLKADLPALNVGDTVIVHYRIIEGSKERIQKYEGVIIKKQGSCIEQTITVRRIVANEGVERVFPVHSPKIAEIEVRRHGHTRRAKLYYLRQRVGKKRRLKDRRRGLGSMIQQDPTPDAGEAAAPEQEKSEQSRDEGRDAEANQDEREG